MQAVTELKKLTAPMDYPQDKERLKKFFLFYSEEGVYKYLDMLRVLDDSLPICLDDLALFDESGLAQRFERHAFSYARLAAEAVDEILEENGTADTADPFLMQRIARFREKFPDKKLFEYFPRLLLRKYSVQPVPAASSLLCSIREIRAGAIGRLVRVRGIVTRVSFVKPCIRVATYICENCGSETYQQVYSDVFDMLEECASEKCRLRNIRGTLVLLSRGSRFVKFQTVHIQELTGDVPRGSIPRTLKIECYGSATGVARPGECRVFCGVFMPRPYYGIRKLKAGLLNDTYLYCTGISEDISVDSAQRGGQPAVQPVIETDRLNALLHNRLSEDDPSDLASAILGETRHASLLDLLVESFAPEIFGMRDVKKALLLMLVGAPSLTKPDGLVVRGDINILLVGDPGIAKSQLLKTVVKLSRRGVYTTGRGSSGAGLTACVAKDPVTNEVVLEGGALVLSDMGVCCIDELDKMSVVDRASIHEVMEQQQVSISKAGINTTLNARCAVLGAANPVRGRYNPRKSVEQNVGLPASLLSRFDVLCLLRDDPDTAHDSRMGAHVASLHMAEGHSPSAEPILCYENIRQFIARAKAISPELSPSLREKLIGAYIATRSSESVTPRYLLGLIRLALAHARANLRSRVTDEDVDCAIALLEDMRIPVERSGHVVSVSHGVYNFTVGLARDTPRGRVVSLAELFNTCTYSRDQIEAVISEFEASGIWMRNNDEIVIFN